MPDKSVVVLDTTVAAEGPVQFSKDNFTKRNLPVRMILDHGAGDTVVIEGGDTSTVADFQTLHSFTAGGEVELTLTRYWRAKRTVDGGGADSLLTVQNSHNQRLVAHEA